MLQGDVHFKAMFMYGFPETTNGLKSLGIRYFVENEV